MPRGNSLRGIRLGPQPKTISKIPRDSHAVSGDLIIINSAENVPILLAAVFDLNSHSVGVLFPILTELLVGNDEVKVFKSVEEDICALIKLGMVCNDYRYAYYGS